VAVRIPGESFALQLARSLDYPVTATSANISGRQPADSADAVISYFGEGLDLVIDGGRTPGGAPSTIVAISGGTITPVRNGQIPFAAVLDAVERARSGEDQ
jgi:L-threonylcarbamoyladenylate synthase